MNKFLLVAEALITVRPVLAFHRAFKKPPVVPSATLRPVIELQPSYRAYTTPAQIQIAAEAFFENRCPVPSEQLLADLPTPALASTIPAKHPTIPQYNEPAHLDLSGWFF